mgnify:CR=1 FL=1
MDTEFALLHNESDMEWREQGLCSGMTLVFFGPAAERPERRVEREALARSFCRACPSALPCRRAGRMNREHGIWGGENDEERAAAGYAPRSPSRRSVIQARDNTRQVADPSAVLDSSNPSGELVDDGSPYVAPTR